MMHLSPTRLFLVASAVAATSLHGVLEAPTDGVNLAVQQGGPPPAQGDEQEAPKEPAVLDRQETLDLVATWNRAQHWTIKGLVLLSLGVSWSPDATPLFVEALTGKQRELAAFAIESLHRANVECLRSTASSELVAQLIDTCLKDKDEHFAGRAQTLLERIFPDTGNTKRVQWQSYWRSTAETYQPAAWIAPPPKEKGPIRTSASAVGRAMDLRDAGLELCFCVDATGSMQDMLAAMAGAAEQMSSLLLGFAPELRVGAVFYKDMGDLSGGAKLVHELTGKHDKVFRKIGDLSADGGEDFPEAVERGLEVALDPRELGWSMSTNKLVIIMGDAPPHPPDVPLAVEMARVAATRGLDPKKVKSRPTTGKTPPARPFVISCIAVTPGAVQPETAAAFREIAEAGGGAYATLSVGGGEAQMRAASQGIVAHVLRMTFGELWKDEVDTFLSIYFSYKERGFFK